MDDEYDVTQLLGFTNLPVNDKAELQKFETFLRLVAERREGVTNENERNWIMVKAYEEAYTEKEQLMDCEAAEVESIEVLKARAKEYMEFYEIIERLSKLATDQRVQERLHYMASDLMDYSQRVENQIEFRKYDKG